MGLLKKISGSLKKISVYALLIIGSVVMGLVILPLERLFIHPSERFQRAGRKTVSASHRLFVRICHALHTLYFDKPLPSFEGLEGKIVVPNHPSLIDVVLLFSLIDGANCIVKGKLLHSAYGAIIRTLYIPNTGTLSDLEERCKEVLSRGDTLIIFPEGTRTREGQPITLKRGAAYIALYTGAPLVPLAIEGNDMKGLRKHDRFWTMTDNGFYRFSFRRLDEIDPLGFQGPDIRRSAINLTKHLEDLFRKEVRPF